MKRVALLLIVIIVSCKEESVETSLYTILEQKGTYDESLVDVQELDSVNFEKKIDTKDFSHINISLFDLEGYPKDEIPLIQQPLTGNLPQLGSRDFVYGKNKIGDGYGYLYSRQLGKSMNNIDLVLAKSGYLFTSDGKVWYSLKVFEAYGPEGRLLESYLSGNYVLVVSVDSPCTDIRPDQECFAAYHYVIYECNKGNLNRVSKSSGEAVLQSVFQPLLK